MKWLPIGIILIAASFVFDAKVGWENLNPRQDSFLLGRGSDRIADYLTWNYFERAEADHWPDTIGYAFPQKISPIFTNIVPLVAFPIKWLRNPDAGPFQYFGWWYLVNFILMGLSGYALLSSMNINNPILLSVGSLFFFLHLAYFERLDHPALIHQWSIVLAFIPFFRKEAYRQSLLLYVGLAVVTATTHPYMLPFAWVFPIAYGIHRFRKNKKVIASLMVAFIPMVLTFLLLWAQGAFAFEQSTASTGGFGYYATNLNTFYNNLGKTRMPLDFAMKYEGSYEGMAYLGAGILGLLMGLFILGGKSLIPKLLRSLKEHSVLVLTIGVFALFSMSNIWTFHQTTLIKWPDLGLEGLWGIFRSSGRYIWPLFYAIVAVSIWLLSQLKLGSPIKLSMLVIALVAQSWDLWDEMHQKLPDEDWPDQMAEAHWPEVLKDFDRIVWYPPFERNLRNQDDASQFVYWAYQFTTPITAGHLPRPDQKAVNQYAEDLDSLLKNPEDAYWKNSLIITQEAYLARFQAWIHAEQVQLRMKEGYVLMTPRTAERARQDHPFVQWSEALDLNAYSFLQDWLLKRDTGYLILLAHDEASNQLSPEFKKWADLRSSKWSEIPYRSAGVSIFKDGVLIKEELKADSVHLQLPLFGQLDAEILSMGGQPSKESWARIGSGTYRPMRRGLNVFHWPHPDSLLRVAQFDTYISELLLFEQQYQVK